MFQSYQDHFLWRARSLMAGRYEDLSRHYDYPLRVDLTGHGLTVEDSTALMVHLHRYRMALRDKGVTALVPRVIALDLPGQGDRVWVRWLQETAAGPGQDWSDVVYQMRGDRAGLRIHAMSYTRLMLPEFGRAATHRRLVRLKDAGCA